MTPSGLYIPAAVAANGRRTAAGREWLARLPGLVDALSGRWRLTLEAPFETGASCAWVAPAVGADGSAAVLKLALPHMEAADEIAGLEFWAGDPAVRLLEADHTLHAMLLERCRPGGNLRALPETEQDVVIARLLRRLWRPPPPGSSFRPLATMAAHWAAGSRAAAVRWPDPGLHQAGLELMETLPGSAADEVLLATDLHAGNVLAAEREPWLVIDPKPFLGDPAYDATQHLLNCMNRLKAAPLPTLGRFAALLGVDAERVRLWLFARLAIEVRDDPADAFSIARAIAP